MFYGHVNCFKMQLLTRIIILVVLLTATGCAPRISLLYRDYKVDPEIEESLYPRIEAALETAGWEVTEGTVDNVVATEQQTMSRRVLYKTVASLEVIPIEDRFVRVLIHPYRIPLIGSRFKLPYLSGQLERKILPDLKEALEAEGLSSSEESP